MRCWCGVILRHWRTNPRRPLTPNECGVSFGSDPYFLGRSRCGFARWHNPEHEGRNLFPGFERFGNLVADRIQTLEKSREGVGRCRCGCRKSDKGMVGAGMRPSARLLAPIMPWSLLRHSQRMTP